MTLINTEGMALIGPGSEWFWTAVSGLVLAVTFFAIYRQLRVARSANAVAHLDAFMQLWTSERVVRYRLDVLVALRAGDQPSQLPLGPAVALANLWDNVGGTTKRGHIDAELFWTEYGNICASWWVSLGPFVQAFRTAEGNATLWARFEWLASVLPEYTRRAGQPSFPSAWTTEALDRRITICRDLIRAEERLRAVTITSPDAVADRAEAPAPRPGPDQAAAPSE